MPRLPELAPSRARQLAVVAVAAALIATAVFSDLWFILAGFIAVLGLALTSTPSTSRKDRR